MMDMARGIRRIGTSRMAMAAAIDQKPPRLIPSVTRASSKVVRSDAEAARKFEAISNAVKVHITTRRSSRLVMIAIVGAAIAPMIAVAVTACPAAPSVM